MRDLIIMRGCPGSGKSTAIKEAGLENYTLSPDTIRLMLRAPEVTENSAYSISQQDNALVFELLDTMLVNRMKTGSPTIIDATHCSSGKFHTKQINRYRELAKQYKYRLFYWEPERENVQTYIDRNQYRDELHQVPENVIRKMYTAWENNNLPKDFVKLNTLAFRDDFANLIKDMSDTYEQVIVVGDIHGCNTVLQKLINQDDELNIKDEKNLYIFVGDYFDRGIENLEVLDTLFDIAEQKNVVLLEGNHEAHWVDWAHDRDTERTDNGMIRFKETTLKQWQGKYNSDKDLKKKLRVLYRKMLPAYFFKFLGKEYIVTHAGLACLPKHHMATWQYISGHGSYDFDVTSAYESRVFPSNHYPIQVFGHRSAKTSEHSKSLEGQVEFGGFLKYLLLNEEDSDICQIRNDAYDKEYLIHENELSKQFKGTYIATEDEEINAIANSKHIIAKKLPNNLLSLNFNKNVFYHAIWNDITIKARGLFVDSISGKVVARSYDKFFNFGEQSDEQKEKESLVYPVRIAKKENGFLGILSWDTRTNQLVLASKSTTEGDHAKLFRDVWNLNSWHNQSLIVQLCQKYNASAIFEVCHPDDVHIVDYNKEPKLFLLDFVPNHLHLKGKNIDLGFSEMLCKLVKKEYKLDDKTDSLRLVEKHICNTPEEMKQCTDAIMKKDNIEGYVLTDNNGTMYKKKTDYYLLWKYRRNTMEDIKIGKRLADKQLEDVEFINFLKEKGCFNNIIEAKQAFESKQ